MNKTKELMRRKSRKEDCRGQCQINFRISKELSEWLLSENLSPTAVFTAACEELGFKKGVDPK